MSKNTVTETVSEWAATGTKVTDNVIPGAKILGFESPSHRRRYPIAVMRKDFSKYEGAKVNFDHVKPGENRPSSSVFGRIRNPRVDETRGLIGDIHFNPAHPLAAAVKWAAENDPSQYNLSHVADLVGNMTPDRWFETKGIEKVHSVDVVSNGGTTSSLFESAARDEGEPTMEIKSMTREQLQAERQDFKILTVTEAAAHEKMITDLNARVTALEAEKTSLTATLDGLKATEALRLRNETRKTAIEAAKLPEHLMTETFKTLAFESSTTDERFTALLAERKELAAKVPTSSKTRTVQENAGNGKPSDGKSFVDFMKGA